MAQSTDLYFHPHPHRNRYRYRSFLRACFLLLLAAPALAADPRLEWDGRLGATLRTENARITLDRNERAPHITLRFWPNGSARSLARAAAVTTTTDPARLRIVYRTEGPFEEPIEVIRTLAARAESPSATLLTEQFTLSATQPFFRAGLEIERPFMIESNAPVTSASELGLIRPRAGGWAETLDVESTARAAEYRMGSAYPRAPRRPPPAVTDADAPASIAIPADTPLLALPLVQVGGPGWRCTVMADPGFGALIGIRMGGGGISGSIRYYNAAQTVALTRQTRTFAFRLQTGNAPRRPLDGALEAYARVMNAEAPPCPEWARRVALIELADAAARPDWPADLERLAQWLTPAERGQAALVLRGWADTVFPYGYDRERGAFDRAWLLPGPGPESRPLLPRVAPARWISPGQLRAQLRAARALGFRVLLEMAEGVAADTGTPYFPAEWAMRGAQGEPIATPNAGLTSYGPLALLDPADPRVADWFLAYTDALLREFGKDLDGLVLAGTWRVPAGMATAGARPAWADGALMDLVRTLRARVKDFNAGLVLLTGDNPGPGRAAAPYALAADGSLNAGGGRPEAALCGLFPGALGVQWEAAPAAARFPAAAWNAETLGLPVVIGGADGPAPARWTLYQRDRVLEVFHELAGRLEREDRPRYLTGDPEETLATSPDFADGGDTSPAPAPGEVNWAADAGTSASASSEMDGRGALAAVRESGGAGWASSPEHSLPEWLQVEFAERRPVTRFVVTSFHDDRFATATAGNLGITEYSIQAWDEDREAWDTVIETDAPQAVRARVHVLGAPLTARRVRLVVSNVAPLDGVARVAGFEVWGVKE